MMLQGISKLQITLKDKARTNEKALHIWERECDHFLRGPQRRNWALDVFLRWLVDNCDI